MVKRESQLLEVIQRPPRAPCGMCISTHIHTLFFSHINTETVLADKPSETISPHTPLRSLMTTTQIHFYMERHVSMLPLP